MADLCILGATCRVGLPGALTVYCAFTFTVRMLELPGLAAGLTLTLQRA